MLKRRVPCTDLRSLLSPWIRLTLSQSHQERTRSGLFAGMKTDKILISHETMPSGCTVHRPRETGGMAKRNPIFDSIDNPAIRVFADIPAKCRIPWRAWAVLLPILALASPLPHRQAVGQQTSGSSAQGEQGRQLSLADQLRVGLKVKTKADRGLIAAVVKAVEAGRLPRALVDSTFLWARERAKRRSKKRELRPIVYFQPALVLRAKKLGLKLPVIYHFPPVAALHGSIK